MCGIAGILGQKTADKEVIIGDMVSAIVHRGPDDNGFYVDNHVGLGMRRLSIIDLSTGKQPIFSADNKQLIFFNGEIYNYKELRQELVEKGVTFKTHTDTEVILHMYEAHGEKMLCKLRGMFTFCIYNTETKKSFMARDFFGIKPLYYLKVDNKIKAFSSEIKSLLKYPGFKPEVNDRAVYDYLSFQYNPNDQSFFKNIYKLPPAHYLLIDLFNDKFEIQKYWSFEFDQNKNLDKKGATNKIFETIKDSVEHHMIADVPVGAFLSGGIDSSVIATMMVQLRSPQVQKESETNKVKTFTVGFDTLTEGVESKETSDFLITDHTEVTIGPDEYFNALPKAVYHFDEPVADPSAIGLYFLAREAAKHVKVVLSGEGSDELFGGYNIYLEPFARARLAWIPKTIINFLVNLPFNFFGKNYLRRVGSKLEDWYIGNASVFKTDELSHLWLKTPYNVSKGIFDIKSLYKKVVHLSDSTKMQYIDIHTWLVGDILAKADKMTMAHSLELRVPFLDTEVAKLAATLPDKFKWHSTIFGGITKYLFREAFKNIIPESTRKRKKLGFPTPIRDWLTSERTPIYEKILSNEYIKNNMNTDYIKNIIDEHVSKQADNSRKIYLLLMLSLWYNTFITDNKNP